MAAALALLAAGCATKDGAPTAPQPANLAVQAQVSNADGASLRVHIYYDHRTTSANGPAGLAAVTLFDRTMPFGQGTTTLPVVIDISGCLADRQRVPATSGCDVVVDLSLVSGTTVLDEQTIQGVTLAPGQTTQLPNVFLTPVHSIVIVPAIDTIIVGQTVQLSDTVKDVTGQVLAGRTVSWTSSSDSIASVSATGLVTAVAASATPVTITAVAATRSATASIVVEPQPMMKLTADTARFASTRGGAIPATQTVVVTNAGGGTLEGLRVAPVAYHGTSSGWLQATLADSTITLAILNTNLPASTDTALVIVSSTNASNSPVAVLVLYTIGQGPIIHVSPAALTFTGTAGGSNPAAQQVAVTNTGGGTLSGLTASVLYPAGGPTGWLGATLGGTTAPTQVTVQPNTASLPPAADTLHATVVLKSSVSGVDSQVVAVTLQLASPVQPKLSTDTLTFDISLGASYVPQSVTVSNAGSGSLGTISTGAVQWGVSAPAGWGTPPTGWLSTSVSGTTVTVSITSTAVPLGGQFSTAIVPISASGGGSAVNLVVQLTVTASFSQVTVGRDHACALASTGAAYCWGDNSRSQTGDGTSATAWPVPVPVAGSHQFASLTAGYQYTCGVLSDKVSIYCWGANESGQLGDGSTTDRNTPVQAQVPTNLGSVVALAAGGASTCATVGANYTSYCWGANDKLQVGTGASSPQTTPFAITSLSSGIFPALSGGRSHMCAVDYTSHEWCWGNDTYLQLARPGALDAVGVGDTSVVALDTTVLAGFAGPTSYTSCVVMQATMTVECWGDNSGGQLGIGTVGGTSATPSKVAIAVGALLSGATGVSTGTFHACAVTGGSAYCWGDDSNGELGNGSTGGQIPNAVAVSGGPTSGFASVSAGYYWTCGLGRDGIVYCWGNNLFGHLGQGGAASTGLIANTPTAVKGQ